MVVARWSRTSHGEASAISHVSGHPLVTTVVGETSFFSSGWSLSKATTTKKTGLWARECSLPAELSSSSRSVFQVCEAFVEIYGATLCFERSGGPRKHFFSRRKHSGKQFPMASSHVINMSIFASFPSQWKRQNVCSFKAIY